MTASASPQIEPGVHRVTSMPRDRQSEWRGPPPATFVWPQNTSRPPRCICSPAPLVSCGSRPSWPRATICRRTCRRHHAPLHARLAHHDDLRRALPTAAGGARRADSLAARRACELLDVRAGRRTVCLRRRGRLHDAASRGNRTRRHRRHSRCDEHRGHTAACAFARRHVGGDRARDHVSLDRRSFSGSSCCTTSTRASSPRRACVCWRRICTSRSSGGRSS